MLYDIDDPAVAEIYDFRVTDQYCYIAMEYFARGHLGQILNEPLAADDALATAIEIAHALSIIHMAGVIHCDLKPGNIMLRNDGSVGLIDFGISQSETHTDINRQEGKSPIIAGTPYYMSPEQALGSGTDERTDLYSLGVILFQMLTGEKPYTGDTYEEIIERHKNAEPPRLPAALSAYQDLINRLMAKDMAMRLGSTRELVEILENLRIAAAADEDHPAVTAQAV
jgi:serine/threonine-protein kinase PpkA